VGPEGARGTLQGGDCQGLISLSISLTLSPPNRWPLSNELLTYEPHTCTNTALASVYIYMPTALLMLIRCLCNCDYRARLRRICIREGERATMYQNKSEPQTPERPKYSRIISRFSMWFATVSLLLEALLYVFCSADEVEHALGALPS
jgi:hypothetical protein